MDFKAVALVLLVYFIRPQDWLPGFIGVGIVSPIMLVAIASMIQRAKTAERKIDFFRTPHDWAVLLYYAYIVATSGDWYATLKSAFPLFAFYYVTVQALSDPPRLQSYLKVWMWSVFTLAAFGMLSIYGWDITGARPMTESMLGRLALGTWMHNNPNALGHTVMTAIPLAYFLYFWKKPMPSKLIAAGVWLVSFSAILETESKGAVLAGFITLIVSYSFGRSKIVQLLLFAAAFAGGGAAMSFMPRMEEMGSLRSDAGVQGRLLAWEQARMAVQNDFTGEGYKQFQAIIKWEKMWLSKATHSSYIKIGADLGYPGMFIYVGILWLGIRTLFRAKPAVDELERSRRSLFTLIAAYCMSNWMIDRAYHTEFFLFMAAIAALHRMTFFTAQPSVSPSDDLVKGPAWSRFTSPYWRPQDATLPGGGGQLLLTSSLLRPSVLDVIMAAAGTWLVFYLWDYILKNL